MTSVTPAADAADRPTHPLKAWRECQLVPDKRGGKRQMGIADAARAIGVPYQTWMNWELYPDEPQARVPAPENMKKIVTLTGGQVRPDHFYNLKELRAVKPGAVEQADVERDQAA